MQVLSFFIMSIKKIPSGFWGAMRFVNRSFNLAQTEIRSLVKYSWKRIAEAFYTVVVIILED